MKRQWEQGDGYWRVGRDVPALTAEQEAELIRRWKTCRDASAADRLVRAQLPHVRAQALRYGRRGPLLADLIAEGNLGIVLALDKFEPERGVPFSAYAAYWVRARMTGCLLAGRGVSSAKYFKLIRERRRAIGEFGEGEKATLALAERLRTTVEKLNQQLVVLDMRWVPYDSDALERGAVVDALCTPGDQEERLTGLQGASRLRGRVRAALKALDARERYIVRRRLMADAPDQPSLAELARHFNVSRERVGQLEARAKRKLRFHMSGGAAPG